MVILQRFASDAFDFCFQFIPPISRITGLLTIFKREFDDSHDKNTTDDTLTIGDKGMDMAKIAKEAEAIFGGTTDTAEVDLDGHGGRTFLRVRVTDIQTQISDIHSFIEQTFQLF